MGTIMGKDWDVVVGDEPFSEEYDDIGEFS